MRRRNFCATTCESCKAFFRRTALRITVLHCASNGLCEITAQTRKLCQKCRLQKCLAIGMRNDKELSEQIDEINSCLTGETEATKQIRQKSAAMAIVPIVKPIVDYCGINQLESSRMTELSDACLVFNYPSLSDNRVTTTDLLELMIITNRMTEVLIQDVITFTKRLRGFQKFCADDQLALLKHGFLDIIYLQGFTCYDPERQEFNYSIVS
ncbi:unnamed protein product [Medioppia subpectinata]|uniref:Nuclear receptor domain-containing protein n=1 Tax=Medioppia subpectinata TaxID=1979941 RepID=A0A7R9KKT7_9ACAR|nr:unnamed protein product [Medioppia subpectinata]CAG2104241.1 unnamed protein product [Medioppia subpectinata]